MPPSQAVGGRSRGYPCHIEPVLYPRLRVGAHRRFLLYAAIGASGALLDFLVFVALVHGFGVDKSLATFSSTSLGIANNFLLNARFNFLVSTRLWLRFVAFYGVGLIGIALTIALLGLLVDGAGVDVDVAKAASMPLVLAVQYVLNSRVSFRVARNSSPVSE